MCLAFCQSIRVFFPKKTLGQFIGFGGQVFLGLQRIDQGLQSIPAVSIEFFT